jgi:hypothetical protein
LYSPKTDHLVFGEIDIKATLESCGEGAASNKVSGALNARTTDFTCVIVEAVLL